MSNKGEPPCLGCKDAKPERTRRGKNHRKNWQKLRERGIAGIDILADGSLASTPIVTGVAMKSAGDRGVRVVFDRVPMAGTETDSASGF